MFGPVLANAYSDEGTLVGSPVTITFPWRSRKLVITNDSTVNTITITIVGTITLSLKPTETLTTTLGLKTVTIDGTGAYRVWAFG